MQMKKTETLPLSLALAVILAPGSWAATVQTARVAPVLRAPLSPAVRVALPAGSLSAPAHLQPAGALTPALAPSLSVPLAPKASAVAPRAETQASPAAAFAPAAEGAAQAAQAKPAEQGAAFDKVFDGVAAKAAPSADAVPGAEAPVASYLSRPASSVLPELKAAWKPAKGPSQAEIKVTQANGPLTDLATSESDVLETADAGLALVPSEPADASVGPDKMLLQRYVVSGAKKAALLEGGLFWVDKDGEAFIHIRATARTLRLPSKLTGPVAVSEDGQNIYAVADGKLRVWTLKSKSDTVTSAVFKDSLLDASKIKSLDSLNAENAGDQGAGVQIAFEGERFFWNGRRLVSQSEGAETFSREAKVTPAGRAIYLEKTAEGTRVWVKPHFGSESKLEDVGTLPFEVKSLVPAVERGVYYAATSEGVVEWDAKERRYRVFQVPGLAESGGASHLDADKQGRVLVGSAYALYQVELADARGYMDSRAAEVRLWSQANPMFVKDGFLNIGDFKFPITKKAPVARPWYKRAWDSVFGRKVPAEVADMGISEKEWKALNLPTNKRLVYDTLKGFTMSQHMLYIGETGGGKTWIAERIAKLTGNDLWMVSMNEYTRNKDLIARETFGEEGKNRTGLTMSTVLRWMTEGGILLLDEMHKPLEGIAVLNNILQNGEYRLPDGRVIKYDKKKSWIIGTMNPVKPPYKGEPPSGELSSRFGMTLEVKYLPSAEEEALLRLFHKGVPAELLKKLVSAANELRKLYPELLPLPIAPRTLMHIAEHAARYPQDGIADIFTKTYNPASIVEDPGIAQATLKVLREQGLMPQPAQSDVSAPGRQDAKEIFKDRSPKPETPPSTTPPPSGHDWRWENQRDDGWGAGHMGFGHRHLPPMPFTSPKDRKVPPVTPEMEGWAASLQNLARMLAQYSPLRLVPFYYLEKHGEKDSNTERRWRVVSGLEEIHYLPEEMGEADREVALGRTAHETWHLLFSRPELIFDEPDFINNMAFQALWWAVEDPRVNNLGLGRHPGARPWVEAAYDKDYQIRQLDFEREAWGQIPLHLQFNYALIYKWRYGQDDPRVTDERVKDALRRAGPAIRRAVATEDAARAFDVIRDQIWPIYKELIEEQVDDETQDQQDQDSQDQQDGQEGQEGQEGQQGQQGKQGKSGKQGKPQKEKTEEQKKKEKEVREKLEQKSKEYRDKHAPKTMDDPEKMSKEEREKAKKEAEKLREKMEKARKEKSEKGQKGPAQKGQPQQGQPGQGEGEGQQSEADKADDAKRKQKQKERLGKADEERKEISARDRAHYQEYLRRVARLVPVMRQQLLHSLRQKLRQRTIHNRDEGDLDPDALPRIPKGDKDIFMEEYSPNKVLYRISLLIDTSGSMDGEKKERAMEGAVMMMEALEKIPGVVFEIVKYDSNPMVLKPFNKKLSPDLKSGVLASIRDGSGSTQAYTALKESIERVRLGKGDKMIIMVNDGDPDYNFDRDAYRKLIAESKDVEVHGIGLGPEAQLVLDLFPPGRGWWLKDAADFAKNLRNILRKKLAGR